MFKHIYLQHKSQGPYMVLKFKICHKYPQWTFKHSQLQITCKGTWNNVGCHTYPSPKHMGYVMAHLHISKEFSNQPKTRHLVSQTVKGHKWDTRENVIILNTNAFTYKRQ